MRGRMPGKRLGRENMAELDAWVIERLADPVTKRPSSLRDFRSIDGVVDARVRLTHAGGWKAWSEGQEEYERWEAGGTGYSGRVEAYRDEIEYDRPVYERFQLDGLVLDVGGGAGTLREFLSEDVRYVSIDPFHRALHDIPQAKAEAYSCLRSPCNFVAAMAEFLPFVEESFDWVHMRSMLDHVQVPDLAMLEAGRVLKPGGCLLVGMYVFGGKDGKWAIRDGLKHFVKDYVLPAMGIQRWRDHHTWHPTHDRLRTLVTNNGFEIVDEYWQPKWEGHVCYLLARKAGSLSGAPAH